MHTRSIPCILVNLSVLQEGIHDSLLQQSCNKYLPFSFSPVTPCFPITPFHVSVSVPTCALKSHIRTVDSGADTRRRASFTSSTLTRECATLSRVRILCAASIRLYKRVAGTLVELPLGLAGGDCRLFFERAPLPKTRTP